MRRGLAISFCILHSAFCIAESPLALMRSATDPSRMSAGDVVFELPAHFADGRETSATMLCWLRFECPRFDPAETAVPPALMAWASHSHEPARATLEGGDELPAFLDLARVPLSPSATWGASGIVPQDAAEVPGAGVYEGRFIVCVNVDTTHDITLTVGGKEFAAALEDNVTAEAFVKMLPMTLNMSELNGNEKYRYLDSSLSASPRHYGSIKSGDIMLYGDNCLVIFYESFQTIYSYTLIGRIIDVSGLEEALGTGDVTITFTP